MTVEPVRLVACFHYTKLDINAKLKQHDLTVAGEDAKLLKVNLSDLLGVRLECPTGRRGVAVSILACQAKGRGFKSRRLRHS